LVVNSRPLFYTESMPPLKLSIFNLQSPDRRHGSGSSRKGFTLIELMIAITILAIVASIGLVTYSKAQVTARDNRRKQDLQAIRAALELYYQKNNRYPANTAPQTSAASQPWINDNGSNPAIPLDSQYIASVPVDPKNSGGSVYTYYSAGPWGTCTTAGSYYWIFANLENTNDPEIYHNKPYPVCGHVLDYANTESWAANGIFISSQ
jgi:prepilin-type N-terminal cleavage/methylation domain-containing protein